MLTTHSSTKTDPSPTPTTTNHIQSSSLWPNWLKYRLSASSSWTKKYTSWPNSSTGKLSSTKSTTLCKPHRTNTTLRYGTIRHWLNAVLEWLINVNKAPKLCKWFLETSTSEEFQPGSTKKLKTWDREKARRNSISCCNFDFSIFSTRAIGFSHV